MPGKTIRYVAYPGKTFGTTPATFELITPALVDARIGTFGGTVELPWYLKAFELSRSLHSGNYGGLPLKTLWALLDIRHDHRPRQRDPISGLRAVDRKPSDWPIWWPCMLEPKRVKRLRRFARDVAYPHVLEGMGGHHAFWR